MKRIIIILAALLIGLSLGAVMALASLVIGVLGSLILLAAILMAIVAVAARKISHREIPPTL